MNDYSSGNCYTVTVGDATDGMILAVGYIDYRSLWMYYNVTGLIKLRSTSIPILVAWNTIPWNYMSTCH